MAKARGEGAYIATVWTTELQCGWHGCDSWKCIMLKVVGHRKGEVVGEVGYPMCMTHLPIFLDTMYFKSNKNMVIRGDGTVEE